MSWKTEQLQIRVTAAQKSALRARARAAGQDLSAYVLARALPKLEVRFAEILSALADQADRTFALAALADLLSAASRTEYVTATAVAPGIARLEPVTQNLVAAMVEQAAHRLGGSVAPPAWTAEIIPLDTPWFAGGLRSLEPYLLITSPVPYRRRNLFVEHGLGARV